MRYHVLTDTRGDEMGASGFTLAELLVAVAITGLLSLAIYSMFASTSEAMQEADSLINTVDRSRFAMERLRSDIRNAGSFGTPGGSNDPWIKPNPNPAQNASVQIAGLMSYGGGDGWQDDTNPLDAEGLLEPNQNTETDTTLQPSFDGVVVIGAYDLPGTFEISNISNDGLSGDIYATQRGLVKLRRNNPFNMNVKTYDFSKNSNFQPIVRPHDGGSDSAIANSILRVQDSQGYFQFTAVSAANPRSDGGGQVGTRHYLDLDFQFPLYRQRNSPRVPDEIGLEPQHDQNQGRSYHASLLDVFWYHVRPDPKNPRNFMLVRERLDGTSVMQSVRGSNWGDFNPANNRAYGDDDYIVITDHVVDFQFWVDCAESANGDGNIEQAAWLRGWRPPPTVNPDNSQGIVNYNCLNPNTPQPGRARVAHVRLSLRSATERTDQQHRANGFPNPSDSGRRRMRTFDLRPEAEGAAAVHTTQMDLELTNFAMRNLQDYNN